MNESVKLPDANQYTPSHAATLLVGVPWFGLAWILAIFYHHMTAAPDHGPMRLLDLVVPHVIALVAIGPMFVPLARKVIKWDKKRLLAKS